MAKPSAPRKPPSRPRQSRNDAERTRSERTEKVCGLPAVAALFTSDPARVERLFYDARFRTQAGPFCKVLAARHKPYRQVPTEELAKIAGTPLHGGILAVAQPRPVHRFDLEAARKWAQAGQPLLILDGVGNPHNLGAIARTMAFFGLEHLVVSDHPGQALPSEAALRVAEGGLEWLDIHQATRLPLVLKRMKPFYRVVGTALGAHRPLETVMRRDGGRPLALVLGNEENGLPPDTLAACEEIATIPGSGRVRSLNVSATAAILIHLLARA